MDDAPQTTTETSLRWNALVSPLPSDEPAGVITTPHDSARRLAARTDVGPLTLTPGERPFVEFRRLDPMTLAGWVEHRCHPVIVEGVHTGTDEARAVRAATRDLHRLVCLLSLAWAEPWQVRTAPQDSSRLPAGVPESDPLPPDWMPALHVPAPDDVPLPAWVRDAWDLVASDTPLAEGLTAWHQGILLQSAHPCFALIAYLGCIEVMARSEWVQDELDRLGEQPESGAYARFKQTAGLVATEDELRLLKEMNAYGLRSRSAHGSPVVGIETSYGATIPLILNQYLGPDGVATASLVADTTDRGHQFMIKLVPAVRRVARRLLSRSVGATDAE